MRHSVSNCFLTILIAGVKIRLLQYIWRGFAPIPSTNWLTYERTFEDGDERWTYNATTKEDDVEWALSMLDKECGVVQTGGKVQIAGWKEPGSQYETVRVWDIASSTGILCCDAGTYVPMRAG